MHLITSLCLILSIIYWFYRLIRAAYNIISFSNIRLFYNQALDIKPVKKNKVSIKLLFFFCHLE
jgi:hypothetical protein